MEEIKIIRSEYVTSAVSKKTCPEERLPEIVFVGRSNVGKSSLINSLTNRKSLARTTAQRFRRAAGLIRRLESIGKVEK